MEANQAVRGDPAFRDLIESYMLHDMRETMEPVYHFLVDEILPKFLVNPYHAHSVHTMLHRMQFIDRIYQANPRLNFIANEKAATLLSVLHDLPYVWNEWKQEYKLPSAGKKALEICMGDLLERLTDTFGIDKWNPPVWLEALPLCDAVYAKRNELTISKSLTVAKLLYDTIVLSELCMNPFDKILIHREEDMKTANMHTSHEAVIRILHMQYGKNGTYHILSSHIQGIASIVKQYQEFQLYIENLHNESN